MGTDKLYEAKNRLFSSINRTLGVLRSFIRAQITASGQYERQKALTQSGSETVARAGESHFLFNALNHHLKQIHATAKQASQLVRYLSTFFAKFKTPVPEIVTLADEIEHERLSAN